MATVGVLTLDIRLAHAHSLKEKRSVIKGLKDRLRHRHNIAIAEIDGQDTWQRAVLAAVTVSADRARAARVLESVEREAAADLGASLTDTAIEWLE